MFLRPASRMKSQYMIKQCNRRGLQTSKCSAYCKTNAKGLL